MSGRFDDARAGPPDAARGPEGPPDQSRCVQTTGSNYGQGNDWRQGVNAGLGLLPRSPGHAADGCDTCTRTAAMTKRRRERELKALRSGLRVVDLREGR